MNTGDTTAGGSGLPPSGTPPSDPGGTSGSPANQLNAMNQSAKSNAASGVDGGVKGCQQKKKSWFAIRLLNDKDGKVVEALTLKLKIPDLGDIERVTSKASDPIRIDELNPGGTGSVKQIEHDSLVWEIAADSATK
jgi:hypothetical protein